MNPKQKLLQQILEEEFRVESLHASFDYSKLSNEHLEDVTHIYHLLEGKNDKLPQPMLSFELLIDRRIIELDEQLYFNRYRLKTFRANLYQQMDTFPVDKYKRFCRTYEKECIKSGLQEGIWSSYESEIHFGKPSEPGDFFANGSPGWKWIAFRELLKDLFAIVHQYKLIRISIYENLLYKGQLMQIGQLMESRNPDNKPIIKKFLEKRLEI